MHPTTVDIARSVRKARSTTDRLDALQGAYAGDECFIVSCGPSLSQVSDEDLDSLLAGALTFAVKHAVERVREHADFLLFNSYNVRRHRPRGTTLSVYSPEPAGRMKQFNRADLVLPHERGEDRLSNSLAVTKAFDDYVLDRTISRPHGPGIMYELAFYLALHLGVRRITTIGWDIADPAGTNSHYYDDNDTLRPPPSPSTTNSTGRRPPDWLMTPYRTGRALLAHRRGRTYNLATMKAGEAELVAESLGPIGRWLSDRSVELRVVSKSPWIAGHVTTLTMADLLP